MDYIGDDWKTLRWFKMAAMQVTKVNCSDKISSNSVKLCELCKKNVKMVPYAVFATVHIIFDVQKLILHCRIVTQINTGFAKPVGWIKHVFDCTRAEKWKPASV